MEGHYYNFDAPLGIYAHESHERLAKMVMAGFVRQDSAQIDAGFIESLGESSNVISPMIDESRISSLVEADDAYNGYGLVVPRFDKDQELDLGGVWYQIKRDGREPAVTDAQYISFPRPTLLSKHEGSQEVEQLTYQFDKAQLESILRMLNKMTKRLQADRPSHMSERANPSPSYNLLQLMSSAPVEDDVLYAIKTHSIDDLSVLFPNNVTSSASKPEADADSQPDEVQHIAEWADFIRITRDLLKQEIDPGESSDVNVHYEVNNKMYYVKLVAEHGQLAAAQILCEDQFGLWQSQSFEVNSDKDEDDADLNMVSTMWDQADILDSLRNGEIIDNDSYEANRLLAAKRLSALIHDYPKLIQVPEPEQRKRPAA